MRLADYDGQQATQQFTLTIDPPLQISTTPLATGKVGVPYSHHLIAQGGDPPYSWFVVTNINELPPGLTLGTTAPDFNNVLTGTPTEAGTFTFPVQVQDSQDNTATDERGGVLGAAWSGWPVARSTSPRPFIASA